ncbi:MAG: hypothetical protein Q4G43_14355 [Mobilicoccus sp.]|nr:hypothetical protein [Mobilicoccus sp.]
MSMNFTTTIGVIDQTRLSAQQRRDVARDLSASWWDCARAFEREIVEVSALGLLPSSLRALADDLADAGHTEQADTVRRAGAAALPRGENAPAWPLRSWRPRTHSRAAARH